MTTKLKYKADLKMIHPQKLIDYYIETENYSIDQRVRKALNNIERLPDEVIGLVRPKTQFDFYGAYVRLG